MKISNDFISVILTDDEKSLLRAGLHEWGGPAKCTEKFALAMGFKSVIDLFDESDDLASSIESEKPLSQRDWTRALIATEIAFASDTIGSGVDWETTTGLDDENTIRCLRQLQRKLWIAKALNPALL
jgi:hypothetical protein